MSLPALLALSAISLLGGTLAGPVGSKEAVSLSVSPTPSPLSVSTSIPEPRGSVIIVQNYTSGNPRIFTNFTGPTPTVDGLPSILAQPLPDTGKGTVIITHVSLPSTSQKEESRGGSSGKVITLSTRASGAFQSVSSQRITAPPPPSVGPTPTTINEPDRGTIIILFLKTTGRPRVIKAPDTSEFQETTTSPINSRVFPSFNGTGNGLRPSVGPPTSVHQTDKGTIFILPHQATESRVAPNPTSIQSLQTVPSSITNLSNLPCPCEPGFVSEPTGRGTIGLLATCVLTLFLCVWTAVHLNVYPRETRFIVRLFHKTGWAFLALFGPEVVLWRTISQWQTAKALCEQHNNIVLGKASNYDNENYEDTEREPLWRLLLFPVELFSNLIQQWEEASTEQFAKPTTFNRTATESPLVPQKPSNIFKHSSVKRFLSRMKAWNWSGWRKHRDKNQTISQQDSRLWCIEHGFFAVMGGFEVSVHQEYRWLLDDGSVVTPKSALILARLKKIPDISGEILSGRSKADHFAKTLVCIQAGWMVLQTISRKAAGLPVTLLELNTLAHVACAVLMYIVWWKKPQNVSEPEQITIDKSLAAVLSSSRFRKNFTTEQGFTVRVETKEAETEVSRVRREFAAWYNDSWLQHWWLSFLKWYNGGNEGASVRAALESAGNLGLSLGLPPPRETGWRDIIPANITNPRREVEKRDPGWEWNPADGLRLIKNAQKTDIGVVMLLPGRKLVNNPFRVRIPLPLHLSKNDVIRLDLMAEYLHSDGELEPDLLSTTVEADGMLPNLGSRLFGPGHHNGQRHLIKRAPNMSIPGNLELSTSRTLAIFAVLGFLYGGVHIFAWNSYFPEPTEQLLFRASASIVTSGGFLLWAAYLLEKFASEYRRDQQLHRIIDLLVSLVAWVATVGMMFIGLGFCVSRVFLVVEAFVSIRRLPLGAYSTVKWATFIPHIGS